jgi:hypothetical protein
MSQSLEKPVPRITLGMRESALRYFSQRRFGPFVMLLAHFIERLPSIIYALAFCAGSYWGFTKYLH